MDGVIVDSTEECLVVTWNAYQEYNGESNFVTMVNEIDVEFAEHFREIRNYIRGMDEYYLVFNCSKGDVKNQTVFEELLSKLDQNEMAKFGKCFFNQRVLLKSKDKKSWLNLHKIYDGIVKLIKRVDDSQILYVVTGKDRESVIDFFTHFEIKIDPGKIFDKEIAKNKMEGIRNIAELENVKLEEISFLDDNVTHIVPPHNEGVKCFMAKWGYGMPEHFKLANEKKIRILDKSEIKNDFWNED